MERKQCGSPEVMFAFGRKGNVKTLYIWKRSWLSRVAREKDN